MLVPELETGPPVRNPELWHRLQSTPITLSDGADLGVLIADRFDIRPAMVADLMTDYRRFLYLAAISDGLLVPSRAVDQVWALHMADQPAWADFSRRMFGEVLDGIPARARPARNPAYRQTLNLLEAEFGIPPKPPIWPGERDFAARAGQSALVGIIGFAVSVPIALSVNFGVGAAAFAFSLAAMVFGVSGEKQFALTARNRDSEYGGDFNAPDGKEDRRPPPDDSRPGFTDYHEGPSDGARDD